MTTDRLPCQHFTLDEDQKPDCTLINRLAPLACETCQDYTPIADDSERTACEVWSRVMGYHRPISAFNAGKQQEHRERRMFVEARIEGGLCG